jgi:ATP-dependent helicase/nuclease subunit B
LFDRNSAYKLPSWRSDRYQRITRALDTAPLRPAARPAPCPPLEARPRKISVTQVELWRRDPYAIYARHVLGLRPLEPLDADPSAADLGSALHKTLETFVARLADQPPPPDAVERFMRDADLELAPLLDRPGVWAFWRPRFQRIAHWFVATEAARRAGGTLPFVLETEATLVVPAPAGPFTLRGKADRIDRLPDGTLAVIDYKTGSLPKGDEVELGFAPQLALEAMMVEAGAFGGERERVTALEYWRFATRDGGEIKRVPKDEDPRSLIAAARLGFMALVATYDRATKRYPAAPRPARVARFNDYVQLARTEEWIGR